MQRKKVKIIFIDWIKQFSTILQVFFTFVQTTKARRYHVLHTIGITTPTFSRMFFYYQTYLIVLTSPNTQFISVLKYKLKHVTAFSMHHPNNELNMHAKKWSPYEDKLNHHNMPDFWRCSGILAAFEYRHI